MHTRALDEVKVIKAVGIVVAVGGGRMQCWLRAGCGACVSILVYSRLGPSWQRAVERLAEHSLLAHLSNRPPQVGLADALTANPDLAD